MLFLPLPSSWDILKTSELYNIILCNEAHPIKIYLGIYMFATSSEVWKGTLDSFVEDRFACIVLSHNILFASYEVKQQGTSKVDKILLLAVSFLSLLLQLKDDPPIQPQRRDECYRHQSVWSFPDERWVRYPDSCQKGTSQEQFPSDSNRDHDKLHHGWRIRILGIHFREHNFRNPSLRVLQVLEEDRSTAIDPTVDDHRPGSVISSTWERNASGIFRLWRSPNISGAYYSTSSLQPCSTILHAQGGKIRFRILSTCLPTKCHAYYPPHRFQLRAGRKKIMP